MISVLVMNLNLLSYQVHSTDGFNRQPGVSDSINGPYVDGLSITHGTPRQHIWTYVAGLTDHGSTGGSENCPCVQNPGRNSPSFVSSNYYCESGAGSNFDNTYYLFDPLWDGAGCTLSTCCSNINLPWFQYQLSEMTQDDIEVRICRDETFSNEGILIDIIELYVQ